MKILHFQCRGQWFKVTEKGHIIRIDIKGFTPSGSWIFMGVSKHHWRRGIDIDLKGAFEAPESIKGGLVWDIDHGTVRQWGGSFNGKVPRITSAHVSQEV